MGQANNRGTFEDRRQAAIERDLRAAADRAKRLTAELSRLEAHRTFTRSSSLLPLILMGSALGGSFRR